jgi:hypothetical protein
MIEKLKGRKGRERTENISHLNSISGQCFANQSQLDPLINYTTRNERSRVYCVAKDVSSNIQVQLFCFSLLSFVNTA